jgi:hypothetical protein
MYSQKRNCTALVSISIFMFMSDLYIPRISPHIFLQQNRILEINKITHRYICENWEQNIIILFWK